MTALAVSVALVVPLWSFAQSGGIDELQNEIRERRQQIEDLQRRQKAYESQITDFRKKATDLNAQLGALNTQVARTELKLKSTELEIETTKLEIEETKERIEVKEQEMAAQRERIGIILRGMNRLDARDSFLEVLVGRGGLSDVFSEMAELERVQADLRKQLNGLAQLKSQLEAQHQELGRREEQLGDYQADLEEQAARLAGDRYVKQNILSEVRGSQRRYESLLAELRAEVNAINAEITSLEKSIRERLSESNQLPEASGGLQWPVPGRTLTALFHDPDYPYRNVFEHPAVDIRAAHGTAVRAAATGYVGRVKNGGARGYSYILLVHGGNLSTVYGHLSRMVVQEDSFVTEGQIIGYSGGTPGTPGAGPFTTGPHLHFETRLNGIPVNPLDYLP